MKFRYFTVSLLLGLLVIGFVPVGAQDAIECEAGFRLFDHELLATDPVCVPEKAQRIAMMETIGVELMLIENVPPAVKMQAYVDQLNANFPALEPQITSFFEEIPDVGFVPPNLEVLVAAKPDLIIAYDFLIDASDALNSIAPTVFMRLIQNVDIEEAFDFHATLWNQSEDAENLLETYQTRVAALSKVIKPVIDGKSVIVGRYDASGLLFFSNNSAYAVLEDAGWEPSTDFAEKLATTRETFAYGAQPVTLEELSVVDGDYLFVYPIVEGGDAEQLQTDFDALLENPLLQGLSVVKNQQLHVVESLWNFNGILSAHYIIDDLWRVLGGEEPTIPNPFTLVEAEATPEASG